MQPGVNCALYALGLHLGFTDMQSVHGASGSNPGQAHIFAAETLLKVMSGEADGNVHFPFWAAILRQLGFTEILSESRNRPQGSNASWNYISASPGDIVVYTLHPCAGPSPGDPMVWRAVSEELACHYGVVRREEGFSRI